MARWVQPNWVATYHPTADAPVSLRNARLVGMVPSSPIAREPDEATAMLALKT
jgi:hypothetical protein